MQNRSSRRGAFVLAAALIAAGATSVRAEEWAFRPLSPWTNYTAEVGIRYWQGWARSTGRLYDTTGAILVSRLDYRDANLAVGEGHFRFDLNNGWFFKGYVGGGARYGGNLIDEDFPPAIDPYSNTVSNLDHSSVRLASADLGYKLVRGPDFHIGAFAGYHYLSERISAYGCNQAALNPDICAGSIPTSIRGITQDSQWHSVRVGVDTALQLGRVKWTTDAAWLPFIRFNGTDLHIWRVGTNPGDFTGEVPDIGNGWGYQLETMLSYRFNDAFSFGVGGRYWHMQADTTTDFNGRVVGYYTPPQKSDWRSDNFGVFVQANFQFGPYKVIHSD